MEEVKKEMFGGDELAISVWQGKYAAEGEVHYDQMHKRLAKEFARIESSYSDKEYTLLQTVRNPDRLIDSLSDYGIERSSLTQETIYELFKDFKYIIPQGSIMYGLGRKDKFISLSNCFVIPSALDSYGGIFKAEQEQVQLMKRRGGVGQDISNLRPEGTSVTNSAGTSTGVVSFMERFSNGTREVAQNGRRGALMLSIDINHPDVEKFATIKSDRSKVTGANISIRLNDEFMEAVKNDTDYTLRFPCDIIEEDLFGFDYTSKEALIDAEYNTLKTGFVVGSSFKKIKAKELWNTIVTQAKENAEPGLMFWDNVLDMSPDSVYPEFTPVSSNPCGEQFLQPYDSCRLMCMNLFSMVKNPFTDTAEVDFELVYKIAYEQQRLMDDLVDLEIENVEDIICKIESDNQPVEVKATELTLWQNILKAAKAGRRTGSGITALADMLAALNLKYDSDQALKIVELVMSTKMRGELDCTIDLSILRGSFEGFDAIKEGIALNEEGFYKPANSFYFYLRADFHEQSVRMAKYGRRNVSFSTIAPTGSVSILTGTSSGCEPLFMPFYMRRKKVNPSDKDVRVDFVDQNKDSWQEFPVLHSKFKDWINIGHPHFVEGDIPTMSNEDLQQCFEESPWYGSTANDIDWVKRVEMQSILQKYTTNAISSTLNLPETVTLEEVQNIYMKSYELKLKGVTVYVEGSRTGVLVSNNEKKTDTFEYKDALKRPDSLEVEIYTTVSKGTKWNVIIGLYDGKPYEVFALHHFTDIKNGELLKLKEGRYDLYTNGELYSENITSEMTGEEAIITRLCSTSLRHGSDVTFLVEQLEKTSGDITSFGKALSRTLKKYARTERIIEKAKCENCGDSSNIVMEEGCLSCKSCGSSKCGG